MLMLFCVFCLSVAVHLPPGKDKAVHSCDNSLQLQPGAK